jgi:hypothetical protein
MRCVQATAVQLVGVPASTHNLRLMWHTMRHRGTEALPPVKELGVCTASLPQGRVIVQAL